MRSEDSDILSSWESAPLPAVVSHIVDAYHRPSRRMMAEAERLHAEALATQGADRPLLEQMAPHLQALVADLQEHFRWEEQSLFPALLAKDTGRTQETALAEEEHAAAEELLVNLRTLTSDYTPPEGASESMKALLGVLEALESSLHRHLYLETHVLFARSMA